MNNFFEMDNEPEIKSVLVIDFMNLVYRLLHYTQKQNPLDVNFVDWKNDMLVCIFAYIREFQPSRVVVAMDTGKSWRKGVYPDYKAKRKDARDESPVDFDKFYSADYFPKFVSDLKEVFKSMVFMDIDTVEADDIAYVLTKKYSKLGVKVIGASNDGDWYQLLKFLNFSQYNPIKRSMVIVENPVHYLTCKVLMGDTSDNIPNVKKGMGKVTADKQAKRLTEYLEESDDTVRSNYELNKRLIDMDLIPMDIQNSITDKYDKYVVEKTDGYELLQFLMAHKLGGRIEDSQKYLHAMNKLV